MNRNESSKTCPYCGTNKTSAANMIDTNANGVKQPHDFTIQVCDHANRVLENDKGYKEHVKSHSAHIEIRSKTCGERLFPYEDDLIILMEIKYCPFCGKRLGIIHATDN